MVTNPVSLWVFHPFGNFAQCQSLDSSQRLLAGPAVHHYSDSAGMSAIQRPPVSRSNSTLRSNAVALAAAFVCTSLPSRQRFGVIMRDRRT
jgi:hypothetical protein